MNIKQKLLALLDISPSEYKKLKSVQKIETQKEEDHVNGNLTAEDYKNFEMICGKIQKRLDHSFAIIPGYYDGCNLAIYNKAGEMVNQITTVNLKNAIEELEKNLKQKI